MFKAKDFDPDILLWTYVSQLERTPPGFMPESVLKCSDYHHNPGCEKDYIGDGHEGLLIKMVQTADMVARN